MTKQSKKKMGYKQYEKLLSEAYQKLDLLAHKAHELQTYFIAYIEYKGDGVMFNDWLNVRIKEELDKAKEKEEKVNEKV